MVDWAGRTLKREEEMEGQIEVDQNPKEHDPFLFWMLLISCMEPWPRMRLVQHLYANQKAGEIITCSYIPYTCSRKTSQPGPIFMKDQVSKLFGCLPCIAHVSTFIFMGLIFVYWQSSNRENWTPQKFPPIQGNFGLACKLSIPACEGRVPNLHAGNWSTVIL